MGMHQLSHYLRHLWSAKTKHGVHSPFVFEFVTQVLPHRATTIGLQIEAHRKASGKRSIPIEIEDFGAGYGGAAQPIIRKTMAQVVRSSARGCREGALLARMCHHYHPRQCLELGTNLGYSALHLLSGLPSDSELITVEGAKQLSKWSATHFEAFGYRPTQINAEFGDALAHRIDWSRFQPDFVLLDGNHRKQATLEYFEFLLSKVSRQAIIVLDDIYWSEEMTEAWRSIQQHPEVTVSIDLFALGICFLNRPQAKEHFRIRFRAW